MPRLKTDYNKIIIYKLVKNDDYENENIYVGSTVDFTSRKSQHKRSCCNENEKNHNCKVYQIIRQNGGWSEWNMVEIEKFPCNDKREAEAREEYWRCEFNAKLNMRRAFASQEQRKQTAKQYSIKNRDKLNERARIRYNSDKQYEDKDRKNKMKQSNIEINNKVKQYFIDNPNEPNEKIDRIKIKHRFLTERYELKRQKYKEFRENWTE